MKKVWLSILIILVSVQSSTEAIPNVKTDTKTEKKADFRIAYNKVRQEEGYYANHPHDLGKKTYAGITKKYNPDWYGWKYIDKYKLQQNQQVTGKDSLMTEFYVLDYYLTIWVKEGFNTLTNQEVANYLFDLRIHVSRRQAIKLINRAYNTNYVNTEYWVDNTLDTFDLTTLKEVRTEYYLKRIKSNPTQIVWKKGWLKRANKI